MVGVDAVEAGSIPATNARGTEWGELLAAIRARVGLVVLLLALAGLAWWLTARQMAGMGTGPGSDLGTLAWFAGVWVVMMAAMMFPSIAPTVALYSRMARRLSPARPFVFIGGYLLVWSAVGIVSYGLFRGGRIWLGAEMSWNAGGRWLAGGILAAAAVYELTPLKDTCLARCQSPFGFLLGNWRDGLRGAATMGIRHAAWCVGCCWALMAALFALGVMSLWWMAVVAALITLEKTLPQRRMTVTSITALLLVLAVLVIAAPHAVPGLVVPSSGGMGMTR
jgi:predicted metal-binding membrane protein